MKKVIGITGSSGFLGQHLLSFFTAKKEIKIIPFIGDVIKQKQVETFVKKCDLIIHLAAKNNTNSDQEILETNIQGTFNVVNACYLHKKGFLTCVERNLTNDAFSVSKSVQKSIISEYNKLGFQGFMMKLDPVIGGKEYHSYFNPPAPKNKLLELLSSEDVCKWIYAFSDAFLTNGSFYVKEFEFWDPIRISVKDLISLLNGQTVENVLPEHAHKILKCNEVVQDV